MQQPSNPYPQYQQQQWQQPPEQQWQQNTSWGSHTQWQQSEPPSPPPQWNPQQPPSLYQASMPIPSQKAQRPIHQNMKTAAILFFFLAFTCGLFAVGNSAWIVISALLQIAGFVCVCLI